MLFYVTRVQCAPISEVSAIGPWFWNQLSVSISALPILSSLVTVSCNTAAWHNRLSDCKHLLEVVISMSEELSGHSLQPTTCTEISSLSRSSWVDRWDLSQAFTVGTLILVLGLRTYKQGMRFFPANCCSLACVSILLLTLPVSHQSSAAKGLCCPLSVIQSS